MAVTWVDLPATGGGYFTTGGQATGAVDMDGYLLNDSTRALVLGTAGASLNSLASGDVLVGGKLEALLAAYLNGGATLGAATKLAFGSRSTLQSSADGYVMLQNNAGTGFTGLRFGGSSASFPMWKSSSTTLAARLADDSAAAPISASTVSLGAGTLLAAASDGTLQVTSSGGSSPTLQLGGTGTTTGVRLAVGASGVITVSDGAGGTGAVQLNLLAATGNRVFLTNGEIDAGEVEISRSGDSLRVNSSVNLRASSNSLLGWASGTAHSTSIDTSLTRPAVGVVQACAATAGTVGAVSHSLNVVAKTTSYTVVTADHGTLFSNTGASGAVTFTLPGSPSTGQRYGFMVSAAQTVNVTAGSSIVTYAGLSAATTRTCATQYATAWFVFDGTNWVGAGTGTWT